MDPALPASAHVLPARRKPALPALTGIRGPLAISILFFHFTPAHLHFLYPVINQGFTFVGFFFVISGFVLSYNYAERAETMVARDFWVARAARLYPVYLFSLLLFYRMIEGEWQHRPHADFWRGLVLMPLLLQSWSPTLATFGNTVAWTLSVEAMLYAAFPRILLTWQRRAGRWKTPGALIAILLGLWLAGMLPHMGYLLLNPDHLAASPDRFTSAFWIRLLKFTPLPYLCTFLAGIVLGRLHAVLPLSPRQRLALAVGALLALWAVFYSPWIGRVPYLLLHGGLLTPLFAALTLGLAGPTPVASVLGWRPLLKLGEASFALYLLHFNAFVLLQTSHVTEHWNLDLLDPWLSYALVLALAFAVLYAIERPGQRAVLRRFPPRRKALPIG